MNPPYLDLFRLLAEGRSDAVAVACDGDRLVLWGELRRMIAACRRKEPGKRRRVVLAEPAPLAFLARLFAALSDGDVPVIPPNFQPQTLQSLAVLPVPDGIPPLSLELYTSGSSGEPKCIGKALRQLDAECRALESCWGSALAGARIAASTPHHHIYGLLFRLLWPLCAGRAFDNTTIAEPASLAARLAALGDTVLVSSPAQLSRLPELLDLGGLEPRPRLVFSSGGPLAPDTARRFAEAWGKAPTEVYGSSESGGIAWRRQCAHGERWTPLPDVELAADRDGALLVRSPFLPDADRLRMEDAVEFGSDGSFRLRGRLDRIVKIEEKRLSLPEMEAWLGEHPAVGAAALAPLTLGRRSVVGAVVATHPGAHAERADLVAALKAHLRRKYDDVVLPRRWRFVDRLPYNERGKLSVDQLVALLDTPL